MDYLLLFFGFGMIITGIIGSFLPVIPGPPLGWLGLLLLHLTKIVPTDWNFLGIALAVALLVTVLDYIIPIVGTKRFGGTKYGVWGSTIGLIFGMFFGPVGIILGPFVGAFVGEFIKDSKDTQKALRAAWGSLVGFLFSTGLKFAVGIGFLIYYIEDTWEYKEVFFPFLKG